MPYISPATLIERLKKLSLSKKILATVSLASLLFFTSFSPSPPPVFSGTVEMNEHYLGAPVAGRIKNRYVDEGDFVEKGQRLIELDHYEQAQHDFKRAQILFEDQAISKQELEYSALALEDQQISSPVKGIVLQKLYNQGEVAAAGTRVIVVGDTSCYWVKIFIPQAMINKLSLGMPAQIHLDSLKEYLEGHVGYISPLAEFTPRAVQTPDERAIQTFAVKVYFNVIPSTLRPGITADVTLKDL